MPSTRRAFVRRAAAVTSLLVGAGCGGRPSRRRPTDETVTPPEERATRPATTHSATTAGEEAATDTSKRSLVLHDVGIEDLPHRSTVGVVSPDLWAWVTEATETGAVDIGTEEGWTPTVSEADMASTPAGPASPRVDLAVAAADAIVVDGETYTVRTTYRAGEASYRLKAKQVGASPEARTPDETDAVVPVSELPPDQRAVALTAITDEDGSVVGYHEERSEAFEAVHDHRFLRYEGETYWVFVAHGDRFVTHTTLWTEPVDTVASDDTVLELEAVDLSTRGREVVAAAVGDGSGTIETVPQTLADAVERYDLLATTTALYRARLTP